MSKSKNQPKWTREMQESIDTAEGSDRHPSPLPAPRGLPRLEAGPGPSAHGSEQPAASTPALPQMGVPEESGPPPASQLLLGNLTELGHASSTPLLGKRVQGWLAREDWSILLGGLRGGGVPSGFS